jgi:hypothetical protein
VHDVDEIYDFIGNVSYRFTMWDVSSNIIMRERMLWPAFTIKPP